MSKAQSPLGGQWSQQWFPHSSSAGVADRASAVKVVEGPPRPCTKPSAHMGGSRASLLLDRPQPVYKQGVVDQG